jgi:hypothetical protein
LWSIGKLANGLRANTWYNGSQPYGMAGFLNDFSSRMVGYATLRQLRVKNGNLREIFFIILCLSEIEIFIQFFCIYKIRVKFMKSFKIKI